MISLQFLSILKNNENLDNFFFNLKTHKVVDT